MTLNFSGILDLYDRLLSREEPRAGDEPDAACLYRRPRESVHPAVARRGHPQTDFGRIEGTVADCLIYGPTEFSENLDVLAAHPEEREYLVRQLSQKLLEPGMTPEKLDTWLKRVTE